MAFCVIVAEAANDQPCCRVQAAKPSGPAGAAAGLPQTRCRRKLAGRDLPDRRQPGLGCALGIPAGLRQVSGPTAIPCVHANHVNGWWSCGCNL